jgi:hypothetical protein
MKLYQLSYLESADHYEVNIAYSHDFKKLESIAHDCHIWTVGDSTSYIKRIGVVANDDEEYPCYFIKEVPFVV